MEGSKNESEFYREILSRAKRARERAAESLRARRRSRKKQVDLTEQSKAAPRRRNFLRHD
jgi:hypothetical protein